jgi:hypothetical protein
MIQALAIVQTCLWPWCTRGRVIIHVVCFLQLKPVVFVTLITIHQSTSSHTQLPTTQ